MATARPRRFRFNRKQRLESARHWLSTFEDKHNSRTIVRAYRKRYAIDLPTSFIELEMLGFEIDADYKQNVIASLNGQVEARSRNRQLRAQAESEMHEVEQDDTFA